jgi:hypothetical protein
MPPFRILAGSVPGHLHRGKCKGRDCNSHRGKPYSLVHNKGRECAPEIGFTLIQGTIRLVRLGKTLSNGEGGSSGAVVGTGLA